MPAKRYIPKHLTTSGTTTVTAKSCYVTSVVIACSVAGTGWTLQIQDGDSPAKTLIPLFTLIVPTDGLPNVNVSFDEPIPMRLGVFILTAGTAGTADVKVGLSQTEDQA